MPGRQASITPTPETASHLEPMTPAELAKAFVCRGSGTCKRQARRVLVIAGRRIPLCGMHARAPQS